MRIAYGDVQTHFAKLIKYTVKINEYLAFCDLGDVIHGLTGVVPNPGVLVCEASQHGGHYLCQISREFLGTSQSA
jgi:hypothetical protein